MPTIYDVAKRAGVSTYTVSSVLNRSARVSEELTRRVEEAVRELNYTPNAVARSLQMRTTKTVGMVIPDIGNPFYTQVIRGIEERLRRDGYSLILSSSGEDRAEQRRQVGVFRARQVDALLVVMTAGSEEDLLAAQDESKPMVFVARVPEFEADAVAADNVTGARLAIEHLIARGHQRIGLITGDLSLSTSSERAEGWKAALAAHGLKAPRELVVSCSWSVEGGYQAARRLLELSAPPTAIFASNFLMLTGALMALNERGIEVPSQVELASSDDSEWLDAFRPRITTVMQPGFEIGQQAAELALWRIADPHRPHQRISLAPKLRVRQ